jgi:hypothetical protein
VEMQWKSLHCCLDKSLYMLAQVPHFPANIFNPQLVAYADGSPQEWKYAGLSCVPCYFESVIVAHLK